jgi:MoxR-like ATPase
MKIHTRYYFTRYPEKYKLADLKPLISLVPRHVEVLIWRMLQNATLYQTTWYVIPEDVRAVVHDVLRHRIGVTYEAEAENILL